VSCCFAAGFVVSASPGFCWIFVSALPSRTARLLLLLLLPRTPVFVADGGEFELHVCKCVWLVARPRLVGRWGGHSLALLPVNLPMLQEQHPRAPLSPTHTKDTATCARLDSQAPELLLGTGSLAVGVQASACGRASFMIHDPAPAPALLQSFLLNTARACCCCRPVLRHKQIIGVLDLAWCALAVAWPCITSCKTSYRRASSKVSSGSDTPTLSLTLFLPTDPSYIGYPSSSSTFLNHVRTSMDKLQCGPGEEPHADQGHDLPHGLHPR